MSLMRTGKSGSAVFSPDSTLKITPGAFGLVWMTGKEEQPVTEYDDLEFSRVEVFPAPAAQVAGESASTGHRRPGVDKGPSRSSSHS
jgi:hypothetical protein